MPTRSRWEVITERPLNIAAVVFLFATPFRWRILARPIGS